MYLSTLLLLPSLLLAPQEDLKGLAMKPLDCAPAALCTTNLGSPGRRVEMWLESTVLKQSRDKLRVVTPAKFIDLLKQSGYSDQQVREQCQNDECVSQLIGALSLDYLLSAELYSISDNRFELSLRLWESEQSLATESVQGDSIDDLKAKIGPLATQVLGPVIGLAPTETPPPTAAGTLKVEGSLPPSERSRTGRAIDGIRGTVSGIKSAASSIQKDAKDLKGALRGEKPSAETTEPEKPSTEALNRSRRGTNEVGLVVGGGGTSGEMDDVDMGGFATQLPTLRFQRAFTDHLTVGFEAGGHSGVSVEMRSHPYHLTWQAGWTVPLGGFHGGLFSAEAGMDLIRNRKTRLACHLGLRHRISHVSTVESNELGFNGAGSDVQDWVGALPEGHWIDMNWSETGPRVRCTFQLRPLFGVELDWTAGAGTGSLSKWMDDGNSIDGLESSSRTYLLKFFFGYISPF